MLKTVRLRINSALLLTPAIMLLLVWIGRFAGADAAAEMGVVPILLWAFAAATTLYIAHLTKPAGKE